MNEKVKTYCDEIYKEYERAWTGTNSTPETTEISEHLIHLHESIRKLIWGHLTYINE